MRVPVLILGLVALNSCSETEVLTYQGRPAATALECEAAYQAANGRAASNATYTNGSKGAVIGTVIGLALVQGMTESHYKTCLARVANSVPGSSGAAASVPGSAVPRAIPMPRTAAASGCIPGGGAMQGGTGYCVGN